MVPKYMWMRMKLGFYVFTLTKSSSSWITLAVIIEFRYQITELELILMLKVSLPKIWLEFDWGDVVPFNFTKINTEVAAIAFVFLNLLNNLAAIQLR